MTAIAVYGSFFIIGSKPPVVNKAAITTMVPFI
jgi:hypothetical protein